MCGRTAQSIRAIEAAARLLLAHARTTSNQQRILPRRDNQGNRQNQQGRKERNGQSNDGGGNNRNMHAGAENRGETETKSGQDDHAESKNSEEAAQNDNEDKVINNKNDDGVEFVSVHNRSKLQNMSPGYSMFIFRKGNDSNKSVIAESRVWGLITRPGSTSNPLPEGPSKHFSALMFNARSEDASDKPSFGRLIRSGQSCILPVDGFYEWKASAKNAIGSDSSKKQPYFVHHANFTQPSKLVEETKKQEDTNTNSAVNQRQAPLYMAGLYNSVPTGRVDEETGEKKILKTFTIFTTSASPQLKWLHTRMPLVLSDLDDIKAWLHEPSPSLLQKLREKVSRGLTSTPEHMAWHPVTKQMNSAQYHGQDCMVPVKIETLPSVTSFFGAMASKAAEQKKEKDLTTKLKDSPCAQVPPGVEGKYAIPREQETKAQSILIAQSSPTASQKTPIDKAEKRLHATTTPPNSKTAHTSQKKAKTLVPSHSSTAKATSGTPSITSFFAPKKK